MSTNHTSAAARHAAAVPARQGSPAGQGDTAQQQVAWQREMERAQMASWFKPPVAAGKDGTAAAPASAPEAPARGRTNAVAQAPRVIGGANPVAVTPPLGMPMEPRAVAGLPIGATDIFGSAAQAPRAAVRFFAEMRPAVAAEAPRETKAPPDVQLHRGASLLPAVGEPADNSAADAEADAVAEPRTQMSSAPDVQAPVRLHEESMPEGQAVWIAMRADDDALAAMLPRIVADLQRGMQDRGQRLHQVVCNGRLVWRDGAEAMATGDTSIPGSESRPTTVDSFHSKGA
ncbi:hypothetical protein J2W23_004506 [Variovorax boronicumulans]|uniref:hypothetical protein n=1 Tax=Variovorax boronicumulans TaxID=436515 RepID=UPI00278AD510|nr:hypothetical protein [Variovorax boronicumulans]MDQ0016105.1 hypothetical protein [Variovorax boronicumulans]